MNPGVSGISYTDGFVEDDRVTMAEALNALSGSVVLFSGAWVLVTVIKRFKR